VNARSSNFPDEESRSAQIAIIDWETYRAGRPIFDRLSDIRSFVVEFDIPPVPEINDGQFAARVATRMYKHVRDAINSAGFFANDELALRASAGSASVLYGDDRYDFWVEARDGTIAIRRGGSRFEDFHRFYGALFMHVPLMVNEIRREIASATERECNLVRGAYIFEFLIHDIAKVSQRDVRIRNWEVMQSVITGIPGNDGVLSNDDSVQETAGRVDVSISRWVDTEAGKRLYRYSLEAPANKEGVALWARFSYGGETYASPSQPPQARIPFNPDLFLAEYDRAYAHFLRDNAIGGLLTSLLDGYEFRTSPYQLP
jgi:hypothetical protein